MCNTRVTIFLQLIGQLESLDKKLEPKLKAALEMISDKCPRPAGSLPSPDSTAKREKEKRSRKRKHSLELNVKVVLLYIAHTAYISKKNSQLMACHIPTLIRNQGKKPLLIRILSPIPFRI